MDNELFEDKPKVKSKKSSKVETLRRKSVIREMLLNRKSTADIVEYCRENYGIGRKRVEKLLTEIYQDFKKYAEKDKEVIYEKNIEVLCSIRDGEKSNISDRINATKELNKMTGNSTEKHSITGDIEHKLEIDINFVKPEKTEEGE